MFDLTLARVVGEDLDHVDESLVGCLLMFLTNLELTIFIYGRGKGREKKYVDRGFSLSRYSSLCIII